MVATKMVAGLFAVALALSAIGAVYSQEAPPMAVAQETMVVTDFPRLFQEKTATIRITTAGIVVDPAVPNPGPYVFTVHNETGIARGVVITGIDRADTPILRYSPMIPANRSTMVNFWIYPEKDFTVRDYTGRRIVEGRSVWTSTHSVAFEAPQAPTTVVAIAPPFVLEPPIEAGVGAGPGELQHVEVSIVDRTLTLSPIRIHPGQVHFMIRNTTTVPRAFAVEVNGEFHHTRILAPGEEDVLLLNLPVGTYRIHTIVGGQMTLNEILVVR